MSSSRRKVPCLRGQQFAEEDDFVKLKPSNRQVRKARSVSSANKSTEPRSLQPTSKRRQRGRSLKKSCSVDKGYSEETTCRVEKIYFSEKNPSTKKRCSAENTTIKSFSAEKLLLAAKHPYAEKRLSREKRSSAENYSPTEKGRKAQKSSSTGRLHSEI